MAIQDDINGRSIGINLPHNRGLRRGEGGWVDELWTLMFAGGGATGHAATIHHLQANHGGRP
jgi:hypothetical protein